MNPLLLILAGAALLMVAKNPPTYGVAATARNAANQSNATANKIRNTAVSVRSSINDAGAAVGEVASTIAQVIGVFSNAPNAGGASLPEYGSATTSAPVISGTDPYLAANGFANAAGPVTVEEDPNQNALDPTFYLPNSFNA